jgi:hypothetical protein
MTGTAINVSKSFEGMKPKWENYLYRHFPEHFDDGSISAIHVGGNNDADPGMRGGFKVRSNLAKDAIYIETPDRMFPSHVLADPRLKVPSFETRISDGVKAAFDSIVERHVSRGLSVEEARAKAADGIAKVAYYDPKTARFVAEPVVKGVSDSMLSGLATPYWNVSQIQKIFKQPMLRGYADRLVSKLGVPNAWADAIQIFSAAYEGSARIANVGHASLEFNTSIASKRRVGTMLSELINIVIDYETQSPDELAVAGQGAWLVGTTVGDMDVFANLVLDIMVNSLIYFGDPDAGFEGLKQIAMRDGTYDQYPDDRPPASFLWENDGVGGGTGPVNTTVGADLLAMFNHMYADKMEELHFLPTKMVVNCGSAMYKVFKWSMLSKVYNQNNPLSVINTAFESSNKIVGTMVTQSGDGLARSFEICPDPMLDPGTPFNPTDEDLMFITFPEFQSALEVNSVLNDVVMLPVAIEKMLLPSAPAYRDGLVRTAMKRVGSLLAPIAKTVHVITGMGTNSRYTPA